MGWKCLELWDITDTLSFELLAGQVAYFDGTIGAVKIFSFLIKMVIKSQLGRL